MEESQDHSSSSDRLTEALEEDPDREATSESSANEHNDVQIDDPLFQSNKGLFKNKERVRVGWVPDGSRIVGRDFYIEEISSYLNDAVLGKSPDNVAITGKTGAGKSLVSRFVARRAQTASLESVNLGVVYIDCAEASTVTQIISIIGQELNRDDFGDASTQVSMPDAGLSKAKFYERLWTILDNYDSVIVILDEVDLLNDDVVLMNLAKAVEKQATVCNLGIVAISNIIGYFEKLNPRTKSVFQAETITFDPYDATHLQNILKERKDAFYPDVVDEGVIELVAALSAQEHGDARKAMKLLRNAGEVAESADADKLHESHVRVAQQKIEQDQFRDFLDGTPTQMKIACLAISLQTVRSSDEYILTGTLYEVYKKLSKKFETKTITIRRFRDILGEMNLHRITEVKSKNFGKNGGNNNAYRLLHDPEVVKEITLADERFEDLSHDEIQRIVEL